MARPKIKSRSRGEGQNPSGLPIPESQMSEGGLDAEKRGLKKVAARPTKGKPFTPEKNRGPAA